MQRGVDGDHIAPAQEIVPILHPFATNSVGRFLGQRRIVKVEQLGAVEGLETLQDPVPDSTAAERADYLALEVKGVPGDGGDVPSAGHYLFVSCEQGRSRQSQPSNFNVLYTVQELCTWDKVSDCVQDGHDDMFGDRDYVGTGDLGHGDLAFIGSVQILHRSNANRISSKLKDQRLRRDLRTI